MTGSNSDAILEAIAFDGDGLVPVIAQQDGSGEVLMMAWMNADAVRETLAEGSEAPQGLDLGALLKRAMDDVKHSILQGR